MHYSKLLASMTPLTTLKKKGSTYALDAGKS